MDPVTILGTAGAVANIVDIITKSIKTLKELHDRWKDADLMIFNLMSQLASLRAALSKITEWISSDLANIPQHHQLVMDLEQSVACCYVLVNTIQTQLSKLEWNDGDSLDLGSRIKVVFEDKASKEFQTYVKRQTSALTLLLAACSCKTSSEQKALLEKPFNREVFEQIKDDSSSLIVLYDNTSVVSRASKSTGASSRLSRVFPFDLELMGSPVYQRAFRSLFRNPIHRISGKHAGQNDQRRLEHDSNLPWKEQAFNSKRIERIIKKDKKFVHRHTIELALMGTTSDAKDNFMTFLRNVSLEDAETLSLRESDIIFETIESLQALLDTFDYDETLDKQSTVSLELLDASSGAVAARITTILKWYDLRDRLRDEKGPSWLQYIENRIRPRPTYFLEHLERILNPAYIPSKLDFLNLPERGGLQELNFRLGQNACKILDIESGGSKMKKWAHQFEKLSAIIYFVDINSYDQEGADVDVGSVPTTRLQESLKLFENIVNSQWFSHKSVILLLFDFEDVFSSKISVSPLSQYHPDYTGVNDAHKAVVYLAGLFLEVYYKAKHHRSIIQRYISFNDEQAFPKVKKDIQHIILNDNIW